MSVLKRAAVESEEGWREKVLPTMPFIKFPDGWEIKIIPPIQGATTRFIAKIEGIEISVYSDHFENLGCYGKPYWEIHPIGGDVARYDLDKPDEMILGICESVVEQMSRKQTK